MIGRRISHPAPASPEPLSRFLSEDQKTSPTPYARHQIDYNENSTERPGHGFGDPFAGNHFPYDNFTTNPTFEAEYLRDSEYLLTSKERWDDQYGYGGQQMGVPWGYVRTERVGYNRVLASLRDLTRGLGSDGDESNGRSRYQRSDTPICIPPIDRATSTSSVHSGSAGGYQGAGIGTRPAEPRNTAPGGTTSRQCFVYKGLKDKSKRDGHPCATLRFLDSKKLLHHLKTVHRDHYCPFCFKENRTVDKLKNLWFNNAPLMTNHNEENEELQQDRGEFRSQDYKELNEALGKMKKSKEVVARFTLPDGRMRPESMATTVRWVDTRE
ncbi:Protein of unknown function [Pyronema omphalodes CBS 100304]|uniref:Uncharacterized protein n=1 Tax=Pyronema omphalodes (strain CBS 100304) TaxID=1076935 RepID=U4LLX5_PYROM|nr:Protein of unknown function [Pyronema omphalodes CBS 100304]